MLFQEYLTDSQKLPALFTLKYAEVQYCPKNFGGALILVQTFLPPQL